MLSSASIPTAELTFLAWDSQFFGLKIGKISITPASADSLNTVLETARIHHYDLIYAFTDVRVILPISTLQTYNGRFVDHKLVYEHTLISTDSPAFQQTICVFTANDDPGRLYELAYQSGEYSRFRVDPAIGETNFQRLYGQWVDNSISGGIADAIFVWQTSGLPKGFITVKKRGDTGVIGLIAADIQHRGQGIGTALVNHVKAYAAESGLARLDVVTQGRNTLACRFYEKNQFVVKSELNVYHLWL